MLLDEIDELKEKGNKSQPSTLSGSRASEITQLKATILSYQSKVDEYDRLALEKDIEINNLKMNARKAIEQNSSLTKE
jgi:hypothetical protein